MDIDYLRTHTNNILVVWVDIVENKKFWMKLQFVFFRLFFVVVFFLNKANQIIKQKDSCKKSRFFALNKCFFVFIFFVFCFFFCWLFIIIIVVVVDVIWQMSRHGKCFRRPHTIAVEGKTKTTKQRIILEKQNKTNKQKSIRMTIDPKKD